MNYKTIKKSDLSKNAVRPNLSDYEHMRSTFKWEDIHGELDWLEQGGLNIAYEAVDRHIKTPLKNKKALLWEGKDGESEEFTFFDLYRLTNRFANVLRGLGVERGDRVFAYMDRIPELYICLLGALKAGAVQKC
jgi:acetyl-CoA synthetase